MTSQPNRGEHTALPAFPNTATNTTVATAVATTTSDHSNNNNGHNNNSNNNNSNNNNDDDDEGHQQRDFPEKHSTGMTEEKRAILKLRRGVARSFAHQARAEIEALYPTSIFPRR